MTENQKTRILFVCLGNIVRSPLAEAVFRRLAEQAGAGEKYEVDSAGTSGWHIGEPPDPRMVKVAARRGLRYGGTARQLRPEDVRRFDWLIAMDSENHAHLLRMADDPAEQARMRMLREFDPQAGRRADVPDPYYGGIDGFEEVYDIVERACRGLLQALEAGQ